MVPYLWDSNASIISPTKLDPPLACFAIKPEEKVTHDYACDIWISMSSKTAVVLSGKL